MTHQEPRPEVPPSSAAADETPAPILLDSQAGPDPEARPTVGPEAVAEPRAPRPSSRAAEGAGSSDRDAPRAQGDVPAHRGSQPAPAPARGAASGSRPPRPVKKDQRQAPQDAPSEPQPKKKERLSTGQMLHLMRLEVDRALRHKYPISCIMIGLDGFMKPEELEHRRTLMPALFGALKRVTFENDVRGLGIWDERFQLAVFPHVAPVQLADLARQLVESAHAIPSPLEGDEGLTISIGIAHNLHEGEITFESLVEEAETGMGLALSAGGDRFIQAHDVESEVDRLKAELEDQIEEIREHQESYFGTKDGEEETWAKGLVAKVLETFEGEQEQSEGVVRLQKEVIALLKAELRAWRETSSVSQLLASQRQIDQLERRVRKLTDSLGVTEKELKRVMAMKSIDVGVASIYRTVQGLSDEDDNAEQKGEMLKNIFEANLALRSELKAAKAS